jgi:integrase
VYDLRHTAATVMLRAGVPPAEAARRLGHSVDVLMRVYAGVFDNERERSNELIDRFVNPSVSLEAGETA